MALHFSKFVLWNSLGNSWAIWTRMQTNKKCLNFFLCFLLLKIDTRSWNRAVLKQNLEHKFRQQKSIVNNFLSRNFRSEKRVTEITSKSNSSFSVCALRALNHEAASKSCEGQILVTYKIRASWLWSGFSDRVNKEIASVDWCWKLHLGKKWSILKLSSRNEFWVWSMLHFPLLPVNII